MSASPDTTTRLTTGADVLTTDEAAAYLKVSRWTLYDLVRHGELPNRRAGRQRLRFYLADLDAYLGRVTPMPTPEARLAAVRALVSTSAQRRPAKPRMAAKAEKAALKRRAE
jgi:excisionase family DNA binding protein